MPKVKILQTNFSTGELSPQAAGRVDIARYANAAKVMKNVLSRTLGGAQKRPGTQYIAPAKHSNKRARLIPYIYSRDAAYMLEVGDTYLRVFKTDGTQVESSPGVPYEIAIPYTEAQVAEIDYSQGEDTMYVFHSDVPIRRLRSFGDAKWDCSAAPFTTTPFAEQGEYPAATLTLSSNTVGTGRTMTAGAAVFLASDVGRAILWNAGIAVITGYTSTTVVTVEVKVVFDSATIPSGSWNLDSSPQADLTPSAKDPIGATITLTLSAAGWRSTDVGKFVRMNSGLVQITAYTSTTIVSGKIIKALTAVTAAPALAWTLESTVWTAGNGYPRTGTLHEQRLVAAGTKKNPQTVWGSRTGEPLDFTIGANDDDAFAFTIGATNQINPISFIAAVRNLLVLTYGGEFSMQSGVEKPITPTNVQIKPQSPHGTGEVKPLLVGKELLFAQRAGKKLRAMGYRYDEDGYKSPDLTTLAEHLTTNGIAGYCFQQEPDPVVWVWLQNGGLVSMTLDRELDLIAWNRHETDGAVESMAVVPAGDSEQVWMITRRKLGSGAVVKYIERMQRDWYPIYGTTTPDPDAIPPEDAAFNWGFQTDCAVTADDAAGKATWTGLGHLEGKEVEALADGFYMGTFTVTAGAITLPRTAKRVLIGLAFWPEIELLTPEIATGEGSSQDSAMSTSALSVKVYNTLGLTIDGDLVLPGRYTGPALLDNPPALFTGSERASKTGWAAGETQAVIGQAAPFPFHLLSVTRTITVNGG